MRGTSFNRPYKGVDSFQVEDAALFFGRDLAAEDVVTRVLSTRCALLHARSGTGKTSLINARIIPQLEQRGCSPIRVTPQDNPLMAVRIGVLQQLLPPLALEIQALGTARKELCSGDADPSLDDLFVRYDELEVSDQRKRSLIRPLAWTGVDGDCEAIQAGMITPFFCRLLRDSTTIEAYREHCNAIAVLSKWDVEGGVPIFKETKVREIIDALSRAEMEEGFRAMLRQLNTPLPGLAAFFDNIREVYGVHRRNFSMVLIFDQFEELFTRFVDIRYADQRDGEHGPDWRLRKQLLREIEEIYVPGTPRPGGIGEATENASDVPVLPLRLVISMRSEYICELDQMPRLVPELDRATYRLGLLGRNEAGIAMKEPAQKYGFEFDDDLVSSIVSDLSHYYVEIESAPLQIICDKLWDSATKQPVEEARRGSEEGAKRRVDTELYRRLGRCRGIMEGYLATVLEGDSDERLEILELLEQLVTVGGTRNIVEKSRLARAMFRDEERREILLDRLVDARIVRCEVRYGGEFVEITHEFLIPSIQGAIAKELYKDPAYASFRRAISTLEDLKQSSIIADGLSDPYLPKDAFGVLDVHREQVKWDQWAEQVMLRSAIVNESDDRSIEFWVRRVDDIGTGAVEAAP